MTSDLFNHLKQYAPSAPAPEPGGEPMYMIPLYFIRRPLDWPPQECEQGQPSHTRAVVGP